MLLSFSVGENVSASLQRIKFLRLLFLHIGSGRNRPGHQKIPRLVIDVILAIGVDVFHISLVIHQIGHCPDEVPAAVQPQPAQDKYGLLYRLQLI